MAYVLQAVIAKKGVLERKPVKGMHLVPLKQDYEMLPFTGAFIRKHRIPSLPLMDEEGATSLPEAIAGLCAMLSEAGLLAYVEAEFWAGDGIQACAIFEHGVLKLGPNIHGSAIDEALSMLGMQIEPGQDEFLAIGLQQHRSTDDWVKAE